MRLAAALIATAAAAACGGAQAGHPSAGVERTLRGLQESCGRIQPYCERLEGKCMSLDECKRTWKDQYRYVQRKDFCYDGIAPTDPSFGCGCCFERTNENEKRLRELLQLQQTLSGLGLATPRDSKTDDEELPIPRLSLDLSSDTVKSVGLLAKDAQGNVWTFNNYAGRVAKLECSDNGCAAEVRGNAHSSLVDDKLPPRGEPGSDPTVPTKGRLLQEKPGEAEAVDAVFSSQLVPSVLQLQFDNIWRGLDPHNPEPIEPIGGKHLIARFYTIPTDEQRIAGIEPIKFELPDLVLDVDVRHVELIDDLVILPRFERKKNLCIQPVRIRHQACLFGLFGNCWVYSPNIIYSGAGLAFGRPGADAHWAKVDVTFTWRPWITVNDPTGKYLSLTESEMSSLRGTVNSGNCVEIFFVPRFQPSSTYGGGACWSGGTANAKIISSDEMVSCGVDETHLAHEIGHALGLAHPGGSHPDGTAGTLMCPSGWQRDNPRRQSRENGDNVVNPLLVNYWGAWTWGGHDCVNGADCGTCNAHFPPDAC